MLATAITSVFGVTEIILIGWFSTQKRFSLPVLKTVVLLDYYYYLVIFSRLLWWIENSKEGIYLKYNLINNIINVDWLIVIQCVLAGYKVFISYLKSVLTLKLLNRVVQILISRIFITYKPLYLHCIVYFWYILFISYFILLFFFFSFCYVKV